MTVRAAESSDELLAARAATGDDAAFETLVVRYQHRVFRLACRLVSETDAPDIMQDAFLQVYRHISTYRGGAQFSTWLYRIVTNAGLMHRRARAGCDSDGVACRPGGVDQRRKRDNEQRRNRREG